MLECYVDDGRHWPRDSQRRIVGCTAFVLDADERRFCERRWRQKLFRHELPNLQVDQWAELVKARRWDLAERSRVLADFEQVVTDHRFVGFYAAMDVSVWMGLDQKRRRVFKSPEIFCFLRVLRLVVDRLEAVSETTPVQLVLAPGADRIVTSAEAIAFTYVMDSRSADRLGDVRFCDPRRSSYFQAVSLMSGRLRAQLGARREGAGRQAAWLKALSATSASVETIGEYWDEAHCERYLASVDWDVPHQRGIRHRCD